MANAYKILNIFKLNINIYVITFLLLMQLSSCKNMMTSKNINEGIIEFEVTYLDDERQNPLIALLPTNMTLKFKDNSTVSHIEGFFGTFRLTYISDSKKGINASLLKVLDKKYIYEVDTTQQAFGYEAMRNLKIENTGKTKLVAGYACQEAKFICEEISKEPLMIYYTNEIEISNPNTNNPFRQINGVLLEFQVKLNDINMKFVAKKVKRENIEDKDFEVPAGYLKVTKAEMEKILESFNNPKK